MNALKHPFILPVLLMVGCFMLFSPALSSETDGGAVLKEMIAELEKKIDDADKKMVAHPSFLLEMRALVEKYKSRLRQVFFFDDFMDKNYTANPSWNVKSGSFFVNAAGRLSNAVIARQPQAAQPAPAKTLEQEALGIVLDGLFGKPKEAAPPAPTQTATAPSAAIYSKTAIPPDFEIDISFVSTSEWGEMEIVLLGSKSLTPHYRLSYKPKGSSDRPIEIIRERGGRKFIIEAAGAFPQLDDGALHRLQWIRFQNGTMQVLINGTEIIKTHEAYYRDEFTGIELVNNGGTYEWASVKALKAARPEAD